MSALRLLSIITFLSTTTSRLCVGFGFNHRPLHVKSPVEVQDDVCSLVSSFEERRRKQCHQTALFTRYSNEDELQNYNNSSSNSNAYHRIQKVKQSAFGKAAIGLNRQSMIPKNIQKSQRQQHNNHGEIVANNNSGNSTRSLSSSSSSKSSQTKFTKVRKTKARVLSTADDIKLQKRENEQEEIGILLEQRDAALLALKTHLGLSLDKSLDILNTYPSLYTELKDLSSKLEYLLNDINIKSKQLKRMLISHPRLMETVLLDSEDNITNTVEVLQTELNLSLEDIKMIQSTSLPAILSYPRSELRKRILVYKLDLEYPTEEMKRIVLKDPRMLRTDARNVRQILHVLKEELDIGKEEVHTMIGKQILLLTYNAESNIRPTIRYLKEHEVGKCLGMVDRQGKSTIKANNKEEMDIIIKERLKALIMGHPKILSSSVEKKLKPTVIFFMKECQLSKYEFGRVMYRRGGNLLEANVERTLVVKVAYLREKLGLDDDGVDDSDFNQKYKIEEQSIDIPPLDYVLESDMSLKTLQSPYAQDQLTAFEKKRLLAQMLATNPDILTFSIENNLQPKFEYFTKTIGFTKEELRCVMLKRPQLFSLSLERNIIPKIETFLEPRSETSTTAGGLGMTMDQVRVWLTQYPQSLTVTLDSRIKPRIRDVVDLGLFMGDNVPLNFLTQTERNWNQWKNRYMKDKIM